MIHQSVFTDIIKICANGCMRLSILHFVQKTDMILSLFVLYIISVVFINLFFKLSASSSQKCFLCHTKNPIAAKRKYVLKTIHGKKHAKIANVSTLKLSRVDFSS